MPTDDARLPPDERAWLKGIRAAAPLMDHGTRMVFYRLVTEAIIGPTDDTRPDPLREAIGELLEDYAATNGPNGYPQPWPSAWLTLLDWYNRAASGAVTEGLDADVLLDALRENNVRISWQAGDGMTSVRPDRMDAVGIAESYARLSGVTDR